jgi:hypothetical protein
MDAATRAALQAGQIVHVRARLIQDCGRDVQVELFTPNGATRSFVDASHLVGAETQCIPLGERWKGRA